MLTIPIIRLLPELSDGVVVTVTIDEIPKAASVIKTTLSADFGDHDNSVTSETLVSSHRADC